MTDEELRRLNEAERAWRQAKRVRRVPAYQRGLDYLRSKGIQGKGVYSKVGT